MKGSFEWKPGNSSFFKKVLPGGFPGGPVINTLCLQHREPGFNSWLGKFYTPWGAAKKKRVKKEGIVETIVIQDSGDGSFEIIAGERRTRAARAAGLEKVPVQLKKYTNSQKLRVALIENIHRSDLNPVEEAQAYAEIMQTDGLTQDQVAESVGKKRSTVANSLRLLKLPNDMLNALAAGSISPGHARALLSVLNPADQKLLFDRITKQGLSVRQCEQQATDLNAGKRASKSIQAPKVAEDTRDPNYIAIEQKFRDMLGTKVQMKGSFDKGSITIEYYNQADLDRIYNVIVKK